MGEHPYGTLKHLASETKKNALFNWQVLRPIGVDRWPIGLARFLLTLLLNLLLNLRGWGAPHVGLTCGAFDFDLSVLFCSVLFCFVLFCFVCQFPNSFGIRISKNTPVNSLE
jgi:hypothetical protein